MKSYYDTLGLPPHATEEAIATAYYQFTSANNKQPLKEEDYIELTIAYHTLIHNAKRRDYDRILSSVQTPVYSTPQINALPSPITLSSAPKNKHVRLSILYAYMLIIALLFAFTVHTFNNFLQAGTAAQIPAQQQGGIPQHASKQ